MNTSYDVICFSHLRWSFVFQRPQHLLSRCARERRVFYVEEPEFVDSDTCLRVTLSPEGVVVVVPLIRHGSEHLDQLQASLLRDFFQRENVTDYVLWYYTPMALGLAAQLSPRAVIYDCMDQLSAFKNAPAALIEKEKQLFSASDLVFTGGASLYEAKKRFHHNVRAFPSSVDVPHFAKARTKQPDPEDQRALPRPRLGFFGVVDERMDLELLAGVAAARPNWALTIIGPVVKVSVEDLPRAPNLHYLGGKSYQELPAYIAGWDVALLPFARNASTEFISPTKTPEYLAAGKPVVSTSIQDVIRPYRALDLVRIADTVPEFVAACEAALAEEPGQRLIKADAFLSRISWDKTWREMREQIDAVLTPKLGVSPRRRGAKRDEETLKVPAGAK